MVVEKTAREVVVGDVFLNNGAVVTAAVPCEHGRSVYLMWTWGCGENMSATVPADHPSPTWEPDHSPLCGQDGEGSCTCEATMGGVLS